MKSNNSTDDKGDEKEIREEVLLMTITAIKSKIIIILMKTLIKQEVKEEVLMKRMSDEKMKNIDENEDKK